MEALLYLPSDSEIEWSSLIRILLNDILFSSKNDTNTVKVEILYLARARVGH